MTEDPNEFAKRMPGYKIQMGNVAGNYYLLHVNDMRRGPNGITPQFTQEFCDHMNKADLRMRGVDCECEWMPPYGWVVEGGCKYHD